MSRDLGALARQVAGWARPGEQVEAYVAHARDADVEVYQGEVESLSTADTEGCGVRVVVDHKQGFAYAGALDVETLAATLDEARDNASFATPDEFVGLPEPDGVAPAALDLYRPELADFPTDAKVALALELERATKAADRRIRALRSARYGDAAFEAAVASSTGVAAAWRRTSCSVVAYAIAGDEDDTKTGFGYSVGRAPTDLDVAEAAAMAAERATRLLGARQPASRALTVVLDPYVTSSLLGILGGTLNGESVLKGRSLFAGRLGEEVAVPALSLVDDPVDPAAYGATTFDAEGLATRRNALIEDGVLRGFVQNTYTGRRSGTASTGSAVRAGFKSTPGVGCRALTVAPGALGPEEVLAQVGDGLLVQSVTGLHSGVNAISGDFSVGAEGLVVRDGALAEPVREVTIASTLQRMLRDVVAVGSDLRWLPGGAAGVTLAVANVSMSGA